VRFWDTSAVVPLLVEQQTSSRVAAWVREDEAIVLWTLTPVEIVSALRRLVRDNALDERDAQLAEGRMGDVVRVSQVIVDTEPVKALATRLLRLHPLRPFDALQLGAALHWAEAHPQGRTLHTLDGRLALAALREGFTVPA
jgi:predicted nucleic acid-binding protein